MQIAERARRVEPFYVMEIAKAAAKLAAEVAHTARPMIFLNIGEPDFTAPERVRQAAKRAVHEGHTQYTQATGLPRLRPPTARSASGCICCCLLYTSPSPRDVEESRMPSSA